MPISVAKSLCVCGISSLRPSGVRNGRLSSVIVKTPGSMSVRTLSVGAQAYLPLFSATSTFFQNRLRVTLAPRQLV
jgi:hypothetical protein